ncbi:MAG: HAMP domain-containing histidine kinase [Clostridiales bacterium]|jgi:signal transduction histidine kinase|nr:HAMP domain-containing histidine kinase [Clostridiales bacterium]
MKNLSIRIKITLWFAIALIIVVSLTYTVILSVSNQVFQKAIKENLIDTVENNTDEVEYFSNINEEDLLDDDNYFISYENGFIEVEDDFLEVVNQVFTALYDSSLALLYGENPIAKGTSSVRLSDSVIQTTRVGGVTYYIFDRALKQEGLEGLWLRGVVAETQGKEEMSSISRLSLILLPILVLFAIIGGYLIAVRTLKPIKQISEAASQIGKGDDLKRRIMIGEGTDELHQLADNFNKMFIRLDLSFEKEQQFTSDASHELRTPMSVIMAQCQYTLEKERTAEEYENALSVIQRQARKMSGLINDMLDFTRLNMKTDRYTFESYNLSESVTSLCTDMAIIREKNIELSYGNIEKGIIYTGNKALLGRALTNLISNAYRYGKENGHIVVSLQRNEASVIISVQDDGVGIAEDEQKKVFYRFYQGDNSRGGIGTGLGLSMVEEIVRFHGGRILLESKKDLGSTFTIILPL